MEGITLFFLVVLVLFAIYVIHNKGCITNEEFTTELTVDNKNIVLSPLELLSFNIGKHSEVKLKAPFNLPNDDNTGEGLLETVVTSNSIDFNTNIITQTFYGNDVYYRTSKNGSEWNDWTILNNKQFSINDIPQNIKNSLDYDTVPAGTITKFIPNNTTPNRTVGWVAPYVPKNWVLLDRNCWYLRSKYHPQEFINNEGRPYSHRTYGGSSRYINSGPNRGFGRSSANGLIELVELDISELEGDLFTSDGSRDLTKFPFPTSLLGYIHEPNVHFRRNNENGNGNLYADVFSDLGTSLDAHSNNYNTEYISYANKGTAHNYQFYIPRTNRDGNGGFRKYFNDRGLTFNNDENFIRFIRMHYIFGVNHRGRLFQLENNNENHLKDPRLYNGTRNDMVFTYIMKI